MQPLRGVVFDMDGLMFNTEDVYYEVGKELLCRRGKEFTHELSDAMMGRPPEPAFRTMIAWCGLDDSWQQLAAESERLFVDMLGDHVVPMPGFLDLLDALIRSSIPRGIATSSTRNVVEAVLSRFDLQPRFHFILTAEDITHGKPHPEIYLTAARKLGLDPREILVLEDSRTGCEAAAAAGAFVVAVPDTHTRNQDFHVADLVVASLADPRIYRALEIARNDTA
jgi:HAD superfamily hydrolase (TIGR01509 family)